MGISRFFNTVRQFQRVARQGGKRLSAGKNHTIERAAQFPAPSWSGCFRIRLRPRGLPCIPARACGWIL